MKLYRMVALAVVAATPAYAGPVDTATFFHDAPVLREGALLGLAVVIGLAGVRLADKGHTSRK